MELALQPQVSVCVDRAILARCGAAGGQGWLAGWSSTQSVSQHALQPGLDSCRGLEVVGTHPSSGHALHVSRYHLKHFKHSGVSRVSLATMLLVMHTQVQQSDVQIALQQEEDEIRALNPRWPCCCSRASEAGEGLFLPKVQHSAVKPVLHPQHCVCAKTQCRFYGWAGRQRGDVSALAPRRGGHQP